MPDDDAVTLGARIRAATLFFMVGLFLAGATAVPLPTEVAAGTALLGDDLSAHGRLPDRVAAWLRTVRSGIESTERDAPFMFYGTDWLAFGHFAIAIAFFGALRDPVRNRWLFTFGMIACALVPPWALVFGPLRGIPPWWRAIDATFGVVGFLPMWLCDRWVRRLERQSP